MFTNFKNKLKVSPSKFQNFPAAASSSASTTPSGSESTSTTTTNENFFSITEEDTPQNSPYKPLKLPAAGGRPYKNGPSGAGGAIPRTRKLSNSSIASDASFRLPAYESPPIYHIQSDLESNCSEMEDTASTAKLDVVTKEQLFDAYKKSLDRYHKYRSRYTDLAQKYKDLERDNGKARSVLVETQEKAIRRINELREQCSLEQQAKAHLEEALRMEMDDMQCKMQAYQTKLKLLGENPDTLSANLSLNDDVNGATSLIDLEDIEGSNKDINQYLEKKTFFNKNENSVPQMAHLQAELEERQQKIEELTANMENAEETIIQLRKQEEENALLLAQTKQAIHSELENKESEVRTLTETISTLQKDLKEAAKKETQLNLNTAELKELREKFKSLQLIKQETDAKLIAAEHILGELKDQQAAKANIFKANEDKLSKAIKDSEQKCEELRQQNAQLNEMIQRYQHSEVSLAEIDNELNRTKNENDNLKETVEKSEKTIQALETEVRKQKKEIERLCEEKTIDVDRMKDMLIREEELNKAIQETRAENDGHMKRIKQLELELGSTNEQNAQNQSETVSALKAEQHKIHDDMDDKVRSLKEELANKEKELKSNANKLAKQKKQFDNQQNRIREQSDEIEMLRIELNKHEQHLSTLQSESRTREEQAEAEKAKLKAQVQSILHDITQIQEEMRMVKESHSELEAEKLKLEQLIETMQQEALKVSDSSQRWREELLDTGNKLHQVESKLQNIETENSQLAERNCLLEEQNNRLEKQLTECERQRLTEEANTNELRLKLDTTEIAMQKLNEKMSQILDENSRMHNAQELMDHDYRTLQDKYDALEKKKLKTEDEQACMREELDQLQQRKLVLETKLRETIEQLQQAEEKSAEEKKNAEAYGEELRVMTKARDRLEKEYQVLSMELNELKAAQTDEEKLQTLLQNQKRRIEDLEHELAEKDKVAKATIDHAKKDSELLNKKLAELEVNYLKLVHRNDESALLREQIANLNTELKQSQQTCQELENQAKLMQELIREKEAKENEFETLKDENNRLKHEAKTYSEKAEIHASELETLKQQLKSASLLNEKLQNTQEELNKLQEIEKNLRTQTAHSEETAAKRIYELEAKLSAANCDIERLHKSNDTVQVEMDALKNKNELKVQSLEAAVKQLREDNERFQQELSKWKIDAEKVANLEQMQIENEYLNKHAKQLETELEEQRLETNTQLKEAHDLREKVKSVQCELYVLRENAEKFDTELAEKQKTIDSINDESIKLRETLTNERDELQRQLVHTKYITEQSDAIQSDLLQKQHLLIETEQKLRDIKLEYDEFKSTHTIEHSNQQEEIDNLRTELQKVTKELETKTKLQQELDALRIELAERVSLEEVTITPQPTAEVGQKPTTVNEAENLRRINETLQRELEDLKYKSTAEITELQEEIEDMQNNAKHIAEKLLEVERLRATLQAQQTLSKSNESTDESTATALSPAPDHGESKAASHVEELLQREKVELTAKLNEIMNEVRDVSERNIFLEQQCENYLILEQSNERLKLQNAKLSRQLDETLVSMQHNEGITANTEFEYLRNIMFQYLTGSANGNNETLVKVISAVLKFSPQQTQVALEKEHQRRSLLNKIL